MEKSPPPAGSPVSRSLAWIKKAVLQNRVVATIGIILFGALAFSAKALFTPVFEDVGKEMSDKFRGGKIIVTSRWHLGHEDQSLNIDAGDGIVEMEPGETFKILQFYNVGILLQGLDEDAYRLYGLDPEALKQKTTTLLGKAEDPSALLNRKVILPIGVRIENTLSRPVTFSGIRLEFAAFATGDEGNEACQLTIEEQIYLTVQPGQVSEFGDTHRSRFAIPLTQMIVPVIIGTFPRDESRDIAEEIKMQTEIFRSLKISGIDFTKPGKIVLTALDGQSYASEISLEPLYREIFKASTRPLDELHKSYFRTKIQEMLRPKPGDKTTQKPD